MGKLKAPTLWSCDKNSVRNWSVTMCSADSKFSVKGSDYSILILKRGLCQACFRKGKERGKVPNNLQPERGTHATMPCKQIISLLITVYCDYIP